MSKRRCCESRCCESRCGSGCGGYGGYGGYGGGCGGYGGYGGGNFCWIIILILLCGCSGIGGRC